MNLVSGPASATSLYTRLAAGILFPLHERLKNHRSVAMREELEQTQWWTAEKLEALRLERLNALLLHASQHVPYYRESLKRAGFVHGAVKNVADLARLPLIGKAEMRSDSTAFTSTQAGPLQRSNTGGSSGEPLIFYMGKDRVSHDVAAKWRATRWWGVDIGDREVVMWGSPIELGAQDRVRALRDKLLRTELLPAFAMSERMLDEFLERIRQRRPRMLFGYPSAFAYLAQHAERRGVAMNHLGIKVAFVTSEKLYDHQREQIERVFACRVANGYGGRDAGFIAHECPAGGMHISAEHIIVEIIDAAGRPVAHDEPGEITVTHLASKDFPFIRYRTGDVGVFSNAQCACGRGLPLLREVQGRATDFVVAQDGTVMHGLALIYVLRSVPGIRAFKIVQEDLRLTRVLLATSSEFDASQLEAIRAGFRARLGDTVQVEIELVEALEPEKSGKFRYVVSKVAPPREPACAI